MSSIEEILEIELINAKDDNTIIQIVIPFSGTTVFKYDPPHQQKIDGIDLGKAFLSYMTEIYSEDRYKITSNPENFSNRGLIISNLEIPVLCMCKIAKEDYYNGKLYLRITVNVDDGNYIRFKHDLDTRKGSPFIRCIDGISKEMEYPLRISSPGTFPGPCGRDAIS